MDLLTYQYPSVNEEAVKEDSELMNVCSIISNTVSKDYDAKKTGKSIIDKVLKITGTEIKDYDYKLINGFVGDVFKLVDAGKASVEEGEKLINTMIICKSLSDKQIAVLDSIKANTDDNELKQACDSVKKAAQASKNIDASSSLEKLKLSAHATGNEYIELAVTSYTDLLVDEAIKLLGKVGGIIASAQAGKDLGMLVGDKIFVADKMSANMLTIDTLNKIDTALNSAILEGEKNYKNEMNYDNAIKLTSSVDMYKLLQIYACDVGKDLVEIVETNEKNQIIATPLIPWATFPTVIKRIVGKMPNYEYLNDTIDSIKQMLTLMDMYDNFDSDIAAYIYTDKSTNASTWAMPYIEKAVQYNILPNYLQMGYTRQLTRAEFCTYIVNLIQQKTGKDINEIILEKGVQLVSPFEDCQYYYVDCAYKLGIISGMDDNKFEPLGSITREQAAKMLVETAKILGINTEVTADYNTDGASDWAVEGINFVISNGIMTGTDNGFDPKSGYSKEQALTSMVRFYEKLS